MGGCRRFLPFLTALLLCIPSCAGKKAVSVPDGPRPDSRLVLLAEQGDVEARYTLGSMDAQGRRVSQDFAKSASWYRMAAEQGHAPAQCSLGKLYMRGRGVPQDYRCLLYTSPSPRDRTRSRMPSSA